MGLCRTLSLLLPAAALALRAGDSGAASAHRQYAAAASCSRRTLLAPAAAAATAAALSVPAARALIDVTPTFEKLPSGVRFVDLKAGTGEVVKEGSRVSLQWVLRRSNGYFVDSSLGAFASGPQGGTLALFDNSQQFDPFIFTVGRGDAIAGIDEAVRGMRKGGVRRVIVPSKLAFTRPLDKSGGPLPAGFGPRRQIERELNKQDPDNYFFFEVECQNVRN